MVSIPASTDGGIVADEPIEIDPELVPDPVGEEQRHYEEEETLSTDTGYAEFRADVEKYFGPTTEEPIPREPEEPEMLTVRVDEFGRTQSGKPKIKMSGVWRYPGKTPTQGMQVGQMIEIQESSFDVGEGANRKTLHGFEAWRPSASPPPSSVNGPAAPPSPAGDEAALRFISNCCGSAIEAQLCKTPGEIKDWALGAQNALKALVGDVSPSASDYD